MIVEFKELNISDKIKKALEVLNFSQTTPIQALVIPKMLKGIDIIGQAQTGTGKTFAFAIPIIEKTNPNIPKIQSLILCPTRELAFQVFQEFKKLIKFYKEIKLAVIYGGESYTKQFQELSKKPHIIIATPGRILDHLKKKKIDLSNLEILTLDEADEMLKMGFQEDLENILKNVPEKRQTVLFSATLPDFIKKIAKKYQINPELLKISPQKIAVSSIEQYYFFIKDSEKNKLLVRVLDLNKPDSVIIFANTKKYVNDINSYLQKNGFSADAIHGDLKQNQRQNVMNRFRE
ncbi:MAG: DEAD/DEAH box helicase, partial [Candidatus Phytoplasma australasiaticum]|nr:DEAD/DEAH box helicase [Candidatus Phytoplasma australasiaticum]